MSGLIQLIFPPQFEPFQPYLSLPYIKGLLNTPGWKCECVDANVDFYWWLFKEWRNQHVPKTDREKYLYSNVETALEIVTNTPEDLLKYRWAINVLDEYLKEVSPNGVKIGLTSLAIGNKYSSEDLYSYLFNPENIFREFFKYEREKILGSPDTQYYMFSLVVLDQLGAALTIAAEIKRLRPSAKIIFGGPMVSRFYKKLVKISWLNEIVDILAPGEAYKVLPKILGIDECYSGHVTPDFDDLEFEKYLSPRLVLPYLVAHGCKWGKCTFCSHHLSYSEYRHSKMVDVVNDISKLVNKFGVEYISFSDEYLSVKQLTELVDLLRQRGVSIKWSTFVRAEPDFADCGFTKKLYEGGARLLMFGFESASQRILSLMKKGNSVSYYGPILKSCKEANIAVRLDFMVGYPTETEEEVQETYDFIRDHSDLLDTPFSSNAVAAFELREDTPVMQDLKKKSGNVTKLLRGDLDEQYELIDENNKTSEAKKRWRHKFISFFKMGLKGELVSPQNKTHQLCFKGLYDQGCFELPVTEIKLGQLESLYVRWNEGVVVVHENGSFIIENKATGGAIELSSSLVVLVKRFSQGSYLHQIFSRYHGWTESEFIKLINFLYRNDYVSIRVESVPQINRDLEMRSTHLIRV